MGHKIKDSTILILDVRQMYLFHFKSLQKFIYTITMILIKMRDEQMIDDTILDTKEITLESLYIVLDDHF